MDDPGPRDDVVFPVGIPAAVPPPRELMIDAVDAAARILPALKDAGMLGVTVSGRDVMRLLTTAAMLAATCRLDAREWAALCSLAWGIAHLAPAPICERDAGSP